MKGRKFVCSKCLNWREHRFVKALLGDYKAQATIECLKCGQQRVVSLGIKEWEYLNRDNYAHEQKG